LAVPANIKIKNTLYKNRKVAMGLYRSSVPVSRRQRNLSCGLGFGDSGNVVTRKLVV